MRKSQRRALDSTVTLEILKPAKMYHRPPTDPEAEEVVIAELEDGSVAGMTETSRSSAEQGWGQFLI